VSDKSERNTHRQIKVEQKTGKGKEEPIAGMKRVGHDQINLHQSLSLFFSFFFFA
jgi:hypothetical protein